MKIRKAEFAAASYRPGDFPPPGLPEIAFAGRSNVGKSSLINVLLNRKRLARTSTTPGRTQAVQFYRVNGRFFFVDLPGYGYARVPLDVRRQWAPLVESYLRDRSPLRGAVMILDIRHPPTEGDAGLLRTLLRFEVHPIVVLTKCDKLSRSRLSGRKSAITGLLADRVSPLPSEPVLFSAVSGQGKDELWRHIRQRLGA
ncbi:MAG: ribosome biogenesis GTP-binding protein YihA/YsxC [Myxococcota bacterium]